MRKRERRQGLAALEFALLLPVVALLGLLLVEGANAMHTYSSMIEASREGARHVLMEGETADVAALVEALVVDLDKEALSTNVTTDPVANTVTVEVSYAYQIFGSQNGLQVFGEEDAPLRFVAQTTMPLP